MLIFNELNYTDSHAPLVKSIRWIAYTMSGEFAIGQRVHHVSGRYYLQVYVRELLSLSPSRREDFFGEDSLEIRPKVIHCFPAIGALDLSCTWVVHVSWMCAPAFICSPNCHDSFLPRKHTLWTNLQTFPDPTEFSWRFEREMKSMAIANGTHTINAHRLCTHM